ncbi:hypothetical protein GCM10011529_12200 [Polymorphobacter glacialis]|uniref:Uncharacterized protein n=2 Tax=Sandarakinorhabdus glacialis TaxID=1614636 RepID=A0A917E6B5_9SPHN|nr:hypothetical protein GCM10011529_12200 [Polymorphobacter glacialis]
MISPLLMALFFGALEYSFILFSFSSMQFGANVVSRRLSVNKVTIANVPARVKTYLPGWFASRATVSVTQSDPANPRTNVIKVRVTLPATAATPIALFTRNASWTLIADASLNQEIPYED